MRGRRMSRTMMPAGPAPSIRPLIAAFGESPAGPTMSGEHRQYGDQRNQPRVEPPSISAGHIHLSPSWGTVPIEFLLAVERDCAMIPA